MTHVAFRARTRLARPSCRILVVDADLAFQHAVSRAAADAGHVATALATIENSIAVASQMSPDLILLDLALQTQTGRVGRDILVELKKHPETEGIPVLVYSNRVVAFDRRHALELGAEDFLINPIDPAVLIAKIERVVFRASSGKFRTSP